MPDIHRLTMGAMANVGLIFNTQRSDLTHNFVFKSNRVLLDSNMSKVIRTDVLRCANQENDFTIWEK